MMAFVKDQQGIFIAEGFGIDGRTIVRGHQHCRVIMRATPQEPDWRVREGGEQMRVPLVHEVQGRYHNQCAASGGLHGELCQVGFAGAGREDDHTQTPGGNPGGQGLTLMGVWRHLQCRNKREWAKLPRTVDERGPLSREGFYEATIVQRRDAKTLHPVVPDGKVNPCFPWRWGMQEQRAPVKRERGRASHKVCWTE